MARLTDSQRALLRHLLFHESFDTIADETGFPYGVIRDDLVTLMHAGMVEIYDEPDSGRPRRIQSYDGDRMQAYLFRASRKGMNEIQHT
jgi:predicted ArsR family transcriptional regulator